MRKSRVMVGSATLAMAESITAMVMPSAMVATAQWRRGIGSPSASAALTEPLLTASCIDFHLTIRTSIGTRLSGPASALAAQRGKMRLARLVPRGTFEYKCGSNVQVHFAITHCYIWLFIVERQLTPSGLAFTFVRPLVCPVKKRATHMEIELGDGSKRQGIQERVKRQRKRQTPWKGLRRRAIAKLNDRVHLFMARLWLSLGYEL